VFENVGNVTNFTKTGLTNGTPYYFIIKAITAAGSFLVYSNEATATPNGIVTPPPPGGGGMVGGSIAISGTAYPNATVTLLRNGNIISTTTANPSGTFAFNVYGQPSGTHTYSVYGIDIRGNSSPSVGFERTISNSVTTSIVGVLLPPTLQVSNSSIKQGETITLSGYTAPNSPVTVNISGGQNLARNTNSNSDGLYVISLNTAGLPKTAYSAVAVANVGGITTPNSFAAAFIVGDITTEPPKPGDCTRRSDLNCDGRVDLIDFSILLYFWDKNDYSKNPRADIDKNGRVELKDLSIMLYDWTG
jgi:hypothetical protein